jgi:hypothetical protein
MPVLHYIGLLEDSNTTTDENTGVAPGIKILVGLGFGNSGVQVRAGLFFYKDVKRE